MKLREVEWVGQMISEGIELLLWQKGAGDLIGRKLCVSSVFRPDVTRMVHQRVYGSTESSMNALGRAMSKMLLTEISTLTSHNHWTIPQYSKGISISSLSKRYCGTPTFLLRLRSLMNICQSSRIGFSNEEIQKPSKFRVTTISITVLCHWLYFTSYEGQISKILEPKKYLGFLDARENYCEFSVWREQIQQIRYILTLSYWHCFE